jgi:formylglycine-generating enzyme required for sulfatase activity
LPGGCGGEGKDFLERGKMKRTILWALALYCCAAASADTFGTGDNQFDIEFVTISDDAVSANGTYINNSKPEGFIDPGHNYRIGIYEITNDQWNKFVNINGTPIGSETEHHNNGKITSAYDGNPQWTDADQPTNVTSWYEAAQFVNWLNVSTGHQAAYKFTGTQGTTGYTFTVWNETDIGYDPRNPFRNSNAFYFLPTEDEWVKAAYWNGTYLQQYSTKNGGYPTEWTSNGGPNFDGQSAGWNFGGTYPDDDVLTCQPWDVTAGYCPEELNGTYDMMGNIWEWMESPEYSGDYLANAARGTRGGAYDFTWPYASLSSSKTQSPYREYSDIGFRVASVPEPATVGLMGLGWLILRKRK